MSIESYNSLRQKRDSIISILHEVAGFIGDSHSATTSSQSTMAKGVVSELKQASEATSLINYSKSLQQGVLTIALVGESVHLKGFLGGALLANKMLVNRYIPAPVVLVYGKRVNVAIYEAGQKRPRMAEWKTFSHELQQHSDGAVHFNFVQIERQLPLLETGIRLINFPGVEDITRRKSISGSIFSMSKESLTRISTIVEYSLQIHKRRWRFVLRLHRTAKSLQLLA